MISHYQEVVVQYLASDPAILISEEYYIRLGDENANTEFWVDALAADIAENVLYLVEVTYNQRPSKLAGKINRYYELLPIIRGALIGGRGIDDRWEIRPWVFLLQDVVPDFVSKIGELAKPRITYLEQTPFPWVYEEPRRLGKEPGKPYRDLASVYQ